MKIGDLGNPFPLRSILFSFAIGLFSLALIAYVLYQARFLLLGPQIQFAEDVSSTQYQRVVTLEGQMFNIVKATLNGRTLFTDEKGNFKEALILENGYTIATLVAQDRFGRNTIIQKKFVFIPQSTVTNQ